MTFSQADQDLMLATALAAIEQGLQAGRQAYQVPSGVAEEMTAPGASFVTLTSLAGLRGCIGSLEARSGLLEGVAENAYSAAFRDHRFPPLGEDELAELTLEISVLSPLVPVDFADEQELLSLMIPGEAGWVLEENHHRGTFLPTVWSALNDPADFLRELKRKAGLPADYWSPSIKAWRYTTTAFSSAVVDIRQRAG
jgi:AmmeMemoRadiSam system protein A